MMNEKFNCLQDVLTRRKGKGRIKNSSRKMAKIISCRLMAQCQLALRNGSQNKTFFLLSAAKTTKNIKLIDSFKSKSIVNVSALRGGNEENGIKILKENPRRKL